MSCACFCSETSRAFQTIACTWGSVRRLVHAVASQRQAPSWCCTRNVSVWVALVSRQTFSDVLAILGVDERERVLADPKVRAVPKDAGHGWAGIRHQAVRAYEDD